MHGESEATLRPRELAPGTALGRYTIVRRIGAGGMAELYLARARGIGGFDKLLALKLVLPHVADDPEFISMFLDEARLAATLDHPNIAHVVDIGRVGNDHFYAMEYVHGLDLRAISRAVTGPLPLEVATTIVLGVAAGLHHAHERHGHDGRHLGLVHRDVSPSNILVTYDGVVKVVDFGIARAEARSKATQAGVIKGKRGYMSPEQCRGDAVDRRSDVFGLGTLLWELTVGQRLFGGENDYAIMSKIVFGMVPDPRQLVPEYPPALAEIVMRALQRDAPARQPTAEVFALELEACVHALRLRSSTHVLAEFMSAHFGVAPYPTLSPPTPAVDEDAQTRLAARVAPPAPPPRRAWIAAVAATAAVLGVAAWWGARAWTASDAVERAAPAAPTAGSDGHAPVDAGPGAVVPAIAVPTVVAVPTAAVVPVDDDGAEPIVLEDASPPSTEPTTRRTRTVRKPGGAATPEAGAPVPARPNQLFPPRD